MLCHNVAAILEIGSFRTRLAAFVISSVFARLSTHSSIRVGQVMLSQDGGRRPMMN